MIIRKKEKINKGDEARRNQSMLSQNQMNVNSLENEHL